MIKGGNIMTTDKPAGVIQFGDGRYHKGGMRWPSPVNALNSAKTYISPKKAQVTLDSLKKSNYCRVDLLQEAKVISVNLVVVNDEGI